MNKWWQVLSYLPEFDILKLLVRMNVSICLHTHIANESWSQMTLYPLGEHQNSKNSTQQEGSMWPPDKSLSCHMNQRQACNLIQSPWIYDLTNISLGDPATACPVWRVLLYWETGLELGYIHHSILLDQILTLFKIDINTEHVTNSTSSLHALRKMDWWRRYWIPLVVYSHS